MILTTELFINHKKEYIQKVYRTRIMFATPKEADEKWDKKEYHVCVQEMRNKKICIFKSHKHFSDSHTGYSVYSSLLELRKFFDLKEDTEFVEEENFGKNYEVPEGVEVKQL